MVKHIICVGAVYIDTILTVPKFPVEDEKLRATSHTRRRGGNCPNTLEVLTQLLHEDVEDHATDRAVASTAGPQLYLLSVLPEMTSEDVAFIHKSLKNISITESCIFRPGFKDAAASYIIQNSQNNTRTIVSHNPLPEMTAQEFAAASQKAQSSSSGQSWYHFEGRIPEVLLPCVECLRSSRPDTIISVECEKPDRTGLVPVARHADVVFFSKLWAESKGYDNPVSDLRKEHFLFSILRGSTTLRPRNAPPQQPVHLTNILSLTNSWPLTQSDFLKHIQSDMRAKALLCCTWGEKGASILQKQAEAEGQWAHVNSWTPEHKTLPVIDTIGAGDTFIAGMIYALACHKHDWSLQKKLNFANELAGRKVYQNGFDNLGALMQPTLKLSVK